MFVRAFAGGTATRLSKAEQDLQRWGPSLRRESWAASQTGSPSLPSELQQPSALSPAPSNPGACAAALTSQALQAGAQGGSRPKQPIEDPGHVTVGQSRHSGGAAEAANQTPLSAGKRQSSVLARLLGHKLERQVGCVAVAMVRQVRQAGSSLLHRPFSSVGMWEVCATLQGCHYACSQDEAPIKQADVVSSTPVHRESLVCSISNFCCRLVALAVPK